MRLTAICALLSIAACTGEQEKNEEPAAADSLAAGQWEASREVTSLRSTDNTTPVIKAKVGDRQTESSCIAESDVKKPSPELFTRGEGDCQYQDLYMSAGRLNGSISCRNGVIVRSLSGSFTKDSFELTVDTTSYLPGSGDYALSERVTGRRTGQCTEKAGS